MTTSTFKAALACGAAILAIAAASGANAQQRTFNIPAESAADSIPEFARQAGVQIIAPDAQLNGVQTPAVLGDLDVRAALKRLLAGSGLAVVSDDGRTIVLRAVGQGQTPDANAQAATPVKEVVVTGTRVEGVTDIPAPLTTITRADIDNGGFSTLQQVFETVPGNLGDISAASSLSGAVGSSSSVASANAEGASGVDLFGLGPQSTLTLMNGQRQAKTIEGQIADTSVIPLALVDKVDVVTGGGSAIYGSDAVAGTVNIITKKDFDGVETDVSMSTPQSGAGAERVQFDQIVGGKWDRGGFVAAYNTSYDWGLDATKAGVVHGPSYDDIVPVPGHLDILPFDQTSSGYLAGHFSPIDPLNFYGTALYTSGKLSNQTLEDTAGQISGFQSDVLSSTLDATLGMRATLNSNWSLDLTGSYGHSNSTIEQNSTISGYAVAQEGYFIDSVTGVLNGQIPIGDFKIKAAAGVEYNDEGVSYTGTSGLSRQAVSEFGELVFPFVENGETFGLRKLELSLAIRNSHYSDFGNATNPQIGLLWKPTDDLTLRANYSTAFRAPDLTDLEGAVYGLIFALPNPAAPGGMTTTLISEGANANLRPETAKTWTAGIDYALPFERSAKLSISYFDIDYTNRIDLPTGAGSFFNAFTSCGCAPAITSNPTPAQAAAFLARISPGDLFDLTPTPFDPSSQNFAAVFPGGALFDDQISNISSEVVRGVQFSIQDHRPTPLGDISAGVTGNYYIALNSVLIAGAPTVSQIGFPGEPTRFRGRANLGVSKDGVSAFLFVSYVSAYKDNIAVPETTISSWTTVDANFIVKMDTVFPKLNSGLVVDFGISNLLDAKPPLFLDNYIGIAYDPANANALRRVFSLSLKKKW